jgi:hypothetical protein
MIVILSGSAIRESSCNLRLYHTVVSGYRPKVTFADTFYGTCFHKFTETLAKTGGSMPLSMVALEKEWNSRPAKSLVFKQRKQWTTLEHCKATALRYWEECWEKKNFNPILDDKKQAAAEITFSVPLCEIGDITFVLQGTIDLLLNIINGGPNILDYKTTSSWKQDEFLHKFVLDPQVTNYIYALSRLVKMYPDSPFYQQFADIGNVGAFIEAIFLKSKPFECQFKRSQRMTKSLKELQFYEDYLFQKCAALAEAIHAGKKPRSEGRFNNSCQGVYGPCAYFDSCATKDLKHKKMILKNSFKVKAFNPLNYDG